MVKARRWISVLSAIMVLLPFAMVLLAAGISTLTGCDANEGIQQTCDVFGLDIGGLLSSLMLGGWLGLFTIPLVMTIAAAWLLVEVIAFVWRRRGQRRRAGYGRG